MLLLYWIPLPLTVKTDVIFKVHLQPSNCPATVLS